MRIAIYRQDSIARSFLRLVAVVIVLVLVLMLRGFITLISLLALVLVLVLMLGFVTLSWVLNILARLLVRVRVRVFVFVFHTFFVVLVQALLLFPMMQVLSYLETSWMMFDMQVIALGRLTAQSALSTAPQTPDTHCDQQQENREQYPSNKWLRIERNLDTRLGPSLCLREPLRTRLANARPPEELSWARFAGIIHDTEPIGAYLAFAKASLRCNGAFFTLKNRGRARCIHVVANRSRNAHWRPLSRCVVTDATVNTACPVAILTRRAGCARCLLTTPRLAAIAASAALG